MFFLSFFLFSSARFAEEDITGESFRCFPCFCWDVLVHWEEDHEFFF